MLRLVSFERFFFFSKVTREDVDDRRGVGGVKAAEVGTFKSIYRKTNFSALFCSINTINDKKYKMFESLNLKYTLEIRQMIMIKSEKSN